MTHIPIGRFSKMTRLSIKALRLYDENGLLPPVHIDSTSGYRYYSAGQARQAEIIRILRSVDMPLDEIRLILNTDDSALANKQLMAHKGRLAEQLVAQERRLAYLETIILHREKIMPYEILIVETKPQLVATVRFHTSLSKIGTDIAMGFATLMRGLTRNQVLPSGSPLIVYHDVIDETSDGDIEIAVPVGRAVSGDVDFHSRELEGGTMASLIHHGPYEEIGPAYHSLASWITEERYEIIGPPREIYINDPQTTVPEALLTRVEFPVSNKRVEDAE